MSKKALSAIVTFILLSIIGILYAGDSLVPTASPALAQQTVDSDDLAKFVALMQYIRSQPTPADVKASNLPFLATLDTALSDIYITGFITPYTGETPDQVKVRLQSISEEDRFTAVMVESYRLSPNPLLLDIVHQLLPLYYVEFFTTAEDLDASAEFLKRADIENSADAFDSSNYAIPLPGEAQTPLPTLTSIPAATPNDRAILVALYNANNGLNWSTTTNWLTSRPIGEWYGVTTNTNGRVTELDLSANGLNGPIPSQLGSLSNLQRLLLYENQLSGSIPSQLGNLANLREIWIYDNHLSGTIPSQLGSLSNLQVLALGTNQLSGTIPSQLGSLSNLQALGLENNQLNGAIPSQLGSLSNLQVLSFANNQLSGNIPSELGNLTNLARLYLSGNGLTGCVPSALSSVPNNDFTLLGLPFCATPATPPATSGDRAVLVALYNATDGPNWSNNSNWLTSRPIGEWHGVTTDTNNRVTELDLSINGLSGTIPSDLGDLSNLQVLKLNNNDLTGAIPAELGRLNNLTELYLYNNDLSGEIPAELGNLTNLQSVYLSGNRLTGCIPSALSGVPNNDFIPSELDLPFCSATATPTPTSVSVDYDTDDDGLIEVSSLAQLDAIRHDLNGDGSPTDSTAYAAAFPNAATGMGCPSTGCDGFELTANLDFDTNGNGQADSGDTYWNGGAGWEPIEDDGGLVDDWFDATFEGNSHVISGLYINRTSESEIGLFGLVSSGGEIRNLGLEGVDVTGGSNTGGLVGFALGTDSRTSLIRANYVTGTVAGGDYGVGGLVGHANGASINTSYAAAAVSGNATSANVGGLVGSNSGSISASYATGFVTGFVFTGGLVGGNSGTITASYATGAVSATGTETNDGVYSYFGGLVGVNVGSGVITASYAIGRVSGAGGSVGGLVGENGDGGTITVSYWDTQTSGQSTSNGGVGKTTSELQSPTGYTGIYANWNLDLDGDSTGDDPWDFGTSSQYPVLDYGGLSASDQRS